MLLISLFIVFAVRVSLLVEGKQYNYSHCEAWGVH